MKIWKNTPTLDGYSKGLVFTENKSEADIALLGGKSLSLNEFTTLKGIFRAGISKDNIPLKEAEAKGIKVCFPSHETIEIIYEETANFTCGLIFKMMYSEIGTLDPWVKFDRTQLKDRVLLVIGNGNIGRRVINKMKCFMRVFSYDVFENSPSELSNLIEQADCITLHIPNQPENISFFNAEKLALMKNGAVLVNTARGAIVNEDALYDEIRNNRIRAAFDVFWQEPYQGKLKEFHPERFYMTPHVASTCRDFLEGCARDLKKFIEELSNA